MCSEEQPEMSDHYLVEVKLRICKGFWKRGNDMNENRVM